MRKLFIFTAVLSVMAAAVPSVSAMTQGELVVEKAFELMPKVKYKRHNYNPDKYIFDCSGFTYTVYKMAGIDLKTRDDDRQATLGVEVAKSDLQPGDLVYFNHNPRNSRDVTHVGIYIGDGKYIHNFNTKVNVTVSDLDSGWHKRYYKGARRLIGVDLR